MPAKKKVSKVSNMGLWDSVSETDPTITKRVATRGGFTAIDAQSQIKRATELFGPFGTVWGLDNLNYTMITSGADNVGILLTGQFYYTYNDVAGRFPIASDMPYKPNDDCVKKLRTDCITKALSNLGFNSDIFEGKYDDNKYVTEMKKKYAKNDTPKAKPKDEPKPEPMPKPDDNAINILMASAEKYECPDGYKIDMVKLQTAVWDIFGKFPTKDVAIAMILNKVSVDNVMVKMDSIEGLD